MEKFLLGELTREGAKNKFKRQNLAIIPVGSVEQHGPHLPLDTDTYDAYYLAKEAAKRVKGEKPIVLPPIYYGVSYHHMKFVGTISISPNTLQALIVEISRSLKRYGVKKILIVNGHGGNEPALRTAAQILKHEEGLQIFIESGGLISKEIKKVIKTKNDVHAGECETSTSLANREELVDKSRIPDEDAKYPSKHLEFSAEERIIWGFNIDEISKQGVLGNPKRASKEKGERLWKAAISNLSKFIEEIRDWQEKN